MDPSLILFQYGLVATDEEQKIRTWLNAPDCHTNFATASNKRAFGTGNWITKHPEYINWKENPSMLISLCNEDLYTPHGFSNFPRGFKEFSARPGLG